MSGLRRPSRSPDVRAETNSKPQAPEKLQISTPKPSPKVDSVPAPLGSATVRCTMQRTYFPRRIFLPIFLLRSLRLLAANCFALRVSAVPGPKNRQAPRQMQKYFNRVHRVHRGFGVSTPFVP